MSWDNFASEVRKHPNNGCKICRYMKTLDKKEAKAFQEVLDNQAFSMKSIHMGLRARGVRVAEDTVSAHRRGKCGGDE
jgi:hypothetical protein